MSWYNLALTLHIVGVLGLFGAVTTEFIGMLLLRRASSAAQVGDIGNVLRHLDKAFGITGALILLSGIYMTIQQARQHNIIAWAIVSLIMFIIMAAVGSITGRSTGEHMSKILAESQGQMTPELERLTHRNPSQFNAAFGPWVVAGIVVLMVFKPDTIVSVVVLLISLLVGYVMYHQLFGFPTAEDTSAGHAARV